MVLGITIILSKTCVVSVTINQTDRPTQTYRQIEVDRQTETYRDKQRKT